MNANSPEIRPGWRRPAGGEAPTISCMDTSNDVTARALVCVLTLWHIAACLKELRA